MFRTADHSDTRSHASLKQLLFIILLGCAAYGNSLTAALQFDDDLLVRGDMGKQLFTMSGLLSSTRWFTDLTFTVNYALHREQVLGYHLVNLTIHLLTATVLYLLIHGCITALQRSWPHHQENEALAFLRSSLPCATAALFICHPVQTQAVTYIIQRYTSLTTLLYLCSLLAYLQARLTRSSSMAWPALCLGCSLLAMKSKEIAATLPLMITLCEYALFRGTLLKNPRFLFTGLLLLLIIPAQMLLAVDSTAPTGLLNRLQSSAAETVTISRTDYLLTQFRVVATYLRLLLLPINQSADYDYPLSHSLADWQVLLAMLLHICLAGSAVILMRASRRHLDVGAAARGISMRLAALGIIWFYVALSVESSLIPIRDVIFEHRMYLPSAGFFMAISAGWCALAGKNQQTRRYTWGVLLLLCALLAAATNARNRLWGKELDLWLDVVAKAPCKARGHHAVGSIYYKKFQLEQALPQLITALELDPKQKSYWATLNSTIAICKTFKGRANDGMVYYSEKEGINPAYLNQWWALSYNNLGLAYEQQGNLIRAREYFTKAATIYPDLDLPWGNLVINGSQRHDAPAAAAALAQLTTINPAMAEAVTILLRSTAPTAPSR